MDAPLEIDVDHASLVWQVLADDRLVEDAEHLRDNFVIDISERWPWPGDSPYFDLGGFRADLHTFELALTRSDGHLRLLCFNDDDGRLDKLLGEINDVFAMLSPFSPLAFTPLPRGRLSALAERARVTA